MIGAFVKWSEDTRPASEYVGYVIDGNNCHIWTGAKNKKGYGVARHGLAHRVRYEREVGPVPEGMVLDHFACDNRACCNPRHVRPVSPRENSLRSDKSVAAKCAAMTHCLHGHPLEGENVIHDLRLGKRRCRICQRQCEKQYKARKRANA